jgi:hypothetical protein
MMAEWIQGGWSGNDFNTKITAQKKFEDMDTKDQAELLLHLKDMSEGGNELAGKALESFEGRLSKEEKTRVEKAQEGPTEFNRIKMDELISALRKSAQTYEEAEARGDTTAMGNAETEIIANREKVNEYFDGLRDKQKLGLDGKQLFIDKNGRKMGEAGYDDTDELLLENQFDGKIANKLGNDLSGEQGKAFKIKMNEKAARLGLTMKDLTAQQLTKLATEQNRLESFYEIFSKSNTANQKLISLGISDFATLQNKTVADRETIISSTLAEYKKSTDRQVDTGIGNYGLQGNGKREWGTTQDRVNLGEIWDEKYT